MSIGPSCGLWPGARGLVGAVVDPDGLLLEAGPLRPAEESDPAEVWLGHVEREFGFDLELVVTPRLARQCRAPRIALELGLRVWLAPSELVALVAAAAWWRPTPRQYATALARLPRTRAARGLLRRMPEDPGPRQLRLL